MRDISGASWVASPELIRFCESVEKNGSLFEREMRKLSIPVIDLFFEEGRIVPASFEFSGENLDAAEDVSRIRGAFPNLYSATGCRVLKASGRDRPVVTGRRVAVIFSGGPAAGGHNVLVGLKMALGVDNTLLGVRNGPKGLLAGELFEIMESDLAQIINTGGFAFMGTDRTKIKTKDQFEQVEAVCRDQRIDCLVIVGGDDSNTNAAVLAEHLFQNVHSDGRGVQVLGVPKTIDGDLQVGDLLPISFGFDTATKTYSEMVGNILQDTLSSRKYWHFVKLMGRSATHVGLEVALQTRPTVAFISEEIAEKRLSLSQIVDTICRAVARRAARDMNYGVVLIPEGLIEFIPEMKTLISELNEVIASSSELLLDLDTIAEKKEFILGRISEDSAKLMASLPDEFEDMLLLDRDSHGNLKVSQIPTEKLLIEMVSARLREMKANPDLFIGEGGDRINLTPEEVKRFVESKFATNSHFFGYEGRCGAPTRFDAAYTFNLGLLVGSLALAGKTGYIAAINALDRGGQALAIPLVGLIHMEHRQGKDEFVIEKTMVKMDSPAFKFFIENRERWATEDCSASPGPLQLWGPVSSQLPMLIALNQGYNSLKFDLGEERKIISD